ncbi:hypothetical protein GIB67_030147 [Kingdonia uniflora]|uniref:NERD domain-containing protein n=1 Tax=Kingdonia uniflora TaxID=39325 RepID=A0A7J7LE56_9MAGN|nr:hypothetical protein GIB67_030147 [Kingdonia uniflora]
MDSEVEVQWTIEAYTAGTMSLEEEFDDYLAGVESLSIFFIEGHRTMNKVGNFYCLFRLKNLVPQSRTHIMTLLQIKKLLVKGKPHILGAGTLANQLLSYKNIKRELVKEKEDLVQEKENLEAKVEKLKRGADKAKDGAIREAKKAWDKEKRKEIEQIRADLAKERNETLVLQKTNFHGDVQEQIISSQRAMEVKHSKVLDEVKAEADRISIDSLRRLTAAGNQFFLDSDTEDEAPEAPAVSIPEGTILDAISPVADSFELLNPVIVVVDALTESLRPRKSIALLNKTSITLLVSTRDVDAEDVSPKYREALSGFLDLDREVQTFSSLRLYAYRLFRLEELGRGFVDLQASRLEMWIELVIGFVVYKLFRRFFYDDQVFEIETTDSNALFLVATRIEKIYGGKVFLGLRIPDPDTGSRQNIDMVLVTNREIVVIAVKNFSRFEGIDADGSWKCPGENKHKIEKHPDPVLEVKKQAVILESYLEKRGISLPEGYLSGRVVLPNPNFRTVHNFPPEVISFNQWIDLKPEPKSMFSGWIKDAFRGGKKEMQEGIQQNLHFILSTAPMWDRLELKENKNLLGEFVEFKGKQDDIQSLRNIKRSKVSRLVIQKTSMFGLARSTLEVLYCARNYQNEGASASDWKEAKVRSSTDVLFQPQSSSKVCKIKLSSIISMSLSA